MNLIVRLAPRGQQSDYEDLAAIEDFGTLLMNLLAQPDAECAIPQDASGGQAHRLSCHGDARPEGRPVRLIRLLAARACYRLSVRLALLGKWISGI